MRKLKAGQGHIQEEEEKSVEKSDSDSSEYGPLLPEAYVKRQKEKKKLKKSLTK